MNSLSTVMWVWCHVGVDQCRHMLRWPTRPVLNGTSNLAAKSYSPHLWPVTTFTRPTQVIPKWISHQSSNVFVHSILNTIVTFCFIISMGWIGNIKIQFLNKNITAFLYFNVQINFFSIKILLLLSTHAILETCPNTGIYLFVFKHVWAV